MLVRGRPRHARRRLAWPIWLVAGAIVVVIVLAVVHAGRGPIDPAGDPGPQHVLPGMTVETAPPPMRGLIVTSLRSEGQAAAEGVEVGDTIAAIDGHGFVTLDKAAAYLHNDLRSTVSLTIVHDQNRRVVALDRAET